ncbi:DUF4102 domain-containing protein [Phreatobacter aquaticus]|uniref:DUF4102 domain-containing protein n=1 Tax=Phreatobacter aquaticus TaxID=2570229 RepID=A0A4D7QK21_9HYPH|nr:site-specific integrase [Phreatobacter aquaticus]QCK87445.1 DUF4102 domain-containing protein [Phreatobacter aquaticus]
MEKGMAKLSARKVASAGKGEHADGGGLVLQVTGTGHKSWQFVFKRGARGEAKRVRLSLGLLADMTLADARAKASELRAELAAGRDPGLLLAPAPRAASPTTSPEQGPDTFGHWAELKIAAMADELRNRKHHDQWKMTLRTYAGDLFPKPLASITRGDVVEVIKPRWLTTPETIQRTLGRIAAVFDYAAAHDAYDGGNPARWDAAMKLRLGPRLKLSRGHMEAMPYGDVPAFMVRLAQVKGTGAQALALVVLTGARSGEVRLATWGEIDPEAAVWSVPAERMKAKKPHKVPLSPAALAILGEPGEPDDYVFHGRKHGRPLSDMTLSKLLHSLDDGGYVPHGFRTSFRMWAQDNGIPYEVAERCLSHEVGNKVSRAYARSDILEVRRPIMADWAAHVMSAFGQEPAGMVTDEHGFIVAA